MISNALDASILNKFTTHLKKTVEQSFVVAHSAHAQHVTTSHLCQSMVEQKGSIGSEILTKYGVTVEQFLNHIAPELSIVAELDSTKNPENVTAIKFSSDAKLVLEKAVLSAGAYSHKYVGTEHLLWGMIEHIKAGGDLQLLQIFQRYGISIEQLENDLKAILKTTSKFPDLADAMNLAREQHTQNTHDEHDDDEITPAINFFTNDLTDKAAQRRMDPLIGREMEVDRLIQILTRRTKNNPLLLGDAGVGKTAIVEGLAQRIVSGDVPAVLRGKKIVGLDMGVLVAGSVFRGEFEARLKQVVDEVKKNPDIILFIDEIHTIVGAGSASGSLDAANMLKPALARGEIRCIGATTFEEYKKHLEKDSALERRFQPIEVLEPTHSQTTQILLGLKKTYETFHRVSIQPEAIDEAIELSMRYIPDRMLPDKAIDLIDEAAAQLRMKEKSDPLEKKLEDFQEALQTLQKEKTLAVGREQFETALGLREREQELLSQIEAMKQQLSRKKRKIIGEITPQSIRRVVSMISSVPEEELSLNKQQKLLDLEKLLSEHIIGQAEAIRQVSSTIRRASLGLNDPKRPLGSFLFAGPSGVGKTELAKTVATLLFHRSDDQGLIRVDMSEFSEAFTVSKLLGSPAGYVGYRESGKFADLVRRRPHSVILFDELEKAHPEVFHLLLQVLEDGRLSDGAGRAIHFNSSIIILTSNIGSEKVLRPGVEGFQQSDDDALDHPREFRQNFMQSLRDHFRPEFLNRLDAIVPFSFLSNEHRERIAQLELQSLQQRLEKHKLRLVPTQSALHFLSIHRFRPEEGARTIRRNIQELVEAPLAQMILSQTLGAETIIELSANDETILLRPIPSTAPTLIKKILGARASVVKKNEPAMMA